MACLLFCFKKTKNVRIDEQQQKQQQNGRLFGLVWKKLSLKLPTKFNVNSLEASLYDP